MIEFRDVSFTYPGSTHPALHGITLVIKDGDLCLVMGPSGAGKSTLLRCINGLVPHFSGGNLHGVVKVNGLDPVKLSPREMSQTVGFVFQDPEAQFVVDRVEDEIAFSLENAALVKTDMEVCMQEALQLLELIPLRKRRLMTLSGGERQRVAIAAALALRPSILVLDEPTSQLDPPGAEEVLQTLLQLNRELGLTVVLAEHRLERVLPYASRVIYLGDEYPAGLSGDPRQVLSQVLLNPPLINLGKALGWDPLPLTIEAAQAFARQSMSELPAAGLGLQQIGEIKHQGDNPAFIQAQAVRVTYGDIPAVRGVSLDLQRSEITVLMGPNGAGKTTLMRSLIGLVPLQAGRVQVDGKDIAGRSVAEICQQVGYLPQDPNALLFADSVLEELSITLRNHHLDPSNGAFNPMLLLERLGLADKPDSYPRDLSAGERQRVAMGAVMVTRPGALLLDEPTRGLDYGAKKILLGILRTWRDKGMAILLVTHDVELAAQVADRVVLLENGLVVADGDPHEVLPNSPAFSPQVARIFPGTGWINVHDVMGGLDASQH
ncbi:MAG TPA: ATP-binding cassette domain-containing protein [Anaerolineales bacterium]